MGSSEEHLDLESYDCLEDAPTAVGAPSQLAAPPIAPPADTEPTSPPDEPPTTAHPPPSDRMQSTQLPAAPLAKQHDAPSSAAEQEKDETLHKNSHNSAKEEP